jgi:hypothetical protein
MTTTTAMVRAFLLKEWGLTEEDVSGSQGQLAVSEPNEDGEWAWEYRDSITQDFGTVEIDAQGEFVATLCPDSTSFIDEGVMCTGLGPEPVRLPDVSVELVGEDGNAFAILGRVQKAMRQAGHGDLIPEFNAEATARGYDNLLAAVMRWVDVQ